MARKRRIEYAGAACHVMARGNQGRDIYADDHDRKLWLWEECLGRYRWSSYPGYVRGGAARPGWLVTERLGMGDESRVTQAIGRLKRKGQPEPDRLKRRLEQVYENHQGEAEA